MTQIQTEEYVVPTWCMPAIINNDFSGLQEDDAAMVKRFMANVEAQNGHGHFAYDKDDYVAFFSRLNDVHSLADECVIVKFCYHVEQAPSEQVA